jgi:hypothetical protein
MGKDDITEAKEIAAAIIHISYRVERLPCSKLISNASLELSRARSDLLRWADEKVTTDAFPDAKPSGAEVSFEEACSDMYERRAKDAWSSAEITGKAGVDYGAGIKAAQTAESVAAKADTQMAEALASIRVAILKVVEFGLMRSAVVAGAHLERAYDALENDVTSKEASDARQGVLPVVVVEEAEARRKIADAEKAEAEAELAKVKLAEAQRVFRVGPITDGVNQAHAHWGESEPTLKDRARLAIDAIRIWLDGCGPPAFDMIDKHSEVILHALERVVAAKPDDSTRVVTASSYDHINGITTTRSISKDSPAPAQPSTIDEAIKATVGDEIDGPIRMQRSVILQLFGQSFNFTADDATAARLLSASHAAADASSNLKAAERALADAKIGAENAPWSFGFVSVD